MPEPISRGCWCRVSSRLPPPLCLGVSAEAGTIAGVASALAMALIGAVSSYISYQQKKFCFSIQRKCSHPVASEPSGQVFRGRGAETGIQFGSIPQPARDRLLSGLSGVDGSQLDQSVNGPYFCGQHPGTLMFVSPRAGESLGYPFSLRPRLLHALASSGARGSQLRALRASTPPERQRAFKEQEGKGQNRGWGLHPPTCFTCERLLSLYTVAESI